MWCKACGQDVPGVASADEGKFRCARCGTPLGSRSPIGEAAASEPSPGPQKAKTAGRSRSDTDTSPHRPPPWDDWDLDDQLGEIRRKLAPGKTGGGDAAKAPSSDATRLEGGHVGPPAWHCTPRTAAKKMPASGGTSISGFVWFVLALGLMALVCGGVLLGWSVVSGRQDLWARGIPFAVGGQVALLFGLVLQLERIWRDGRQTANRLEHVDEELHGLKSTTAMLGTTHSSAASSFYCHMAGGANSQLLLNDLKGQLDMLAVKIGQQEQRRA